MPQILKNVELDEISLVDIGANQGADVVIAKRGYCEHGVSKCDGDHMCDKCKAKKARMEEIEKAPDGIQFNIGFKEGGGSEVQSVVFDSSKWGRAKAEAWLKDHDMSAGKVDETENTLRYRQKDPAGFERFRMIKPGGQISKALRAKQSINQMQARIETALREKFAPKDQSQNYPVHYLWIRDLWRDSAVFDQDGQTYRVDYSVDLSGTEPVITLGEKIPVEVVYQDVKKSVGSDVVKRLQAMKRMASDLHLRSRC